MMAEIPVQRKSSMNWVLWLIGLIILGLILWWILAESNDRDSAYDDTVAMQEVPPVGQTLVQPPIETNAQNPSLAGLAVGDQVDLDGLTVASVTGDMSFNVVDRSGRQAMVVFNQTPTPNTPTEGRLDINQGMVINLRGRVMGANQPLPAGVDATIPPGTATYIMADNIDVAQRSATPGTTTAGNTTSNDMTSMNMAASNAAAR